MSKVIIILKKLALGIFMHYVAIAILGLKCACHHRVAYLRDGSVTL